MRLAKANKLDGRALLVICLVCFGCGETSSAADGGMDSGTDAGSGGSGTDAGVTGRTIFVTSTVHTADLGGIEGADSLCQTQATNAGLDGSFAAWLSTRSSSIASRIERDGGPFVLVDGTLVADDWDDLVDGSIATRINLDPDGEVQGGDVWTGTLADGDSYPTDDCAGFTSDSGGIALCGATGSTGRAWTQNITPSCGTRLRVYCVEQ